MLLIGNYKTFIEKYNKEVFSIVYIFLLIHFFWGTTMIQIHLSRCYTWICLVVLLGYIIGKILVEPNRKYLIIMATIVAPFIISGLLSGYHELMYVGLLIAAAKDIPIDRILKDYLMVCIPFLLITILGSQIGIVENLIYPSLYRGNRIAYGFLSPTDFCAHVLFIILVLFSVIKKKNYWKMALISVLIAAFLYFRCDGRTTVASLLIFLTGIAICYIIKKWVGLNKRIEWLLVDICESFIVIASFVLGWLYQLNNKYIIGLNDVLSDRLKYIAQTMSTYNIKLWGQYIEEHGNGGSIIAKDNYFFIDNSFVRCMYEYGAIVFVLVIVLIFMAQKKMLDNEKYIMCLAFFIVTIASFAEHHLLEIAYNPFIFSVFACMSNNDKVIMEEKRIC